MISNNFVRSIDLSNPAFQSTQLWVATAVCGIRVIKASMRFAELGNHDSGIG